jgi:hypothetical protein
MRKRIAHTVAALCLVLLAFGAAVYAQSQFVKPPNAAGHFCNFQAVGGMTPEETTGACTHGEVMLIDPNESSDYTIAIACDPRYAVVLVPTSNPRFFTIVCVKR